MERQDTGASSGHSRECARHVWRAVWKERAIATAAYREALGERTRETVPLDWAMTQNNLGAARFSTLGEREPGTARLEEAVARLAVVAWLSGTRGAVPPEWATTQNNLGSQRSWASAGVRARHDAARRGGRAPIGTR